MTDSTPVMHCLTRAQVRRVDRLASERYGVPGVVLMENAGRHAAEAVLWLLVERGVPIREARVAVLCGGGNNGGDGYVIARHLHNAGVAVRISALKPVDWAAGIISDDENITALPPNPYLVLLVESSSSTP